MNSPGERNYRKDQAAVPPSNTICAPAHQYSWLYCNVQYSLWRDGRTDLRQARRVFNTIRIFSNDLHAGFDDISLHAPALIFGYLVVCPAIINVYVLYATKGVVFLFFRWSSPQPSLIPYSRHILCARTRRSYYYSNLSHDRFLYSSSNAWTGYFVVHVRHRI